jgi:hypothetical protein
MVDSIRRRLPTSVWGCIALLTAVVVIAAPLVGLVAREGLPTYGRPGVVATCLAALVCWFASVASLLATSIFRGPQMALFSMLFGMLFRMGLPLMVGLAVNGSVPQLAAVGVFGQIVVFYLITLVTERMLALSLVASAHSVQAAG